MTEKPTMQEPDDVRIEVKMSELRNLQTKANSLKYELENTCENLEEAQTLVDDLRVQNEVLKTEKHVMQKRIDELEANLIKTSGFNPALMQEVAYLKSELVEARAPNQALMTERNSLRDMNRELARRLNDKVVASQLSPDYAEMAGLVSNAASDATVQATEQAMYDLYEFVEMPDGNIEWELRYRKVKASQAEAIMKSWQDAGRKGTSTIAGSKLMTDLLSDIHNMGFRNEIRAESEIESDPP